MFDERSPIDNSATEQLILNLIDISQDEASPPLRDRISLSPPDLVGLFHYGGKPCKLK